MFKYYRLTFTVTYGVEHEFSETVVMSTVAPDQTTAIVECESFMRHSLKFIDMFINKIELEHNINFK